MPTHSTVDAKNNLSALIDRALAGEEVVITRHGQPVVTLQPVGGAASASRARPITEEDLAWLRAIRARVGGSPAAEDAGTFVSRMRDEDTH
jgi:prevent-host-death family protein